jgi:hypothetical protein
MAKIESRQVIADYQEASSAVGFKTEQGLEDYMALKADITELLRNAVFSAYGGLFASNPPVSFPDIDKAKM